MRTTVRLDPEVAASAERLRRERHIRLGEAVNDAVVEVEGNMTHPGMAPLTARVEGGENGLYRLPFTWSMGGDWVLTVVARLPDGRQIQADVPVAVEGR